MSSSLPPQDPTQPQEPVNLRDPMGPGEPGLPEDRGLPNEQGRPQEHERSQDPGRPQGPASPPDPGPSQDPGRPRRRADRPTAPAAARASVRAAGRAVGLVATEPRRRRAQRRARVALGRAVAAHLASQPTPPLLAMPMAAHRAAQLRLASTDPPPRPDSRPGPGDGPAMRPSGTGAVAEPKAPEARPRVASRASRSAGRRDLAAELERLLLIVVLFLPRLAAKVRLRAADERLGAWATGISDPQDPVVAAARAQATEAQRAAVSARVAASANWRQATDAARLAVRLVSEAVVDLTFWVGHGIRSGWSMLVAWLVSVGVAVRRRFRHGSAAAGRHVRASSAATREGLRAGSAAAGRGMRGAGRGVAGAGAGLAGAAGGLAARIDALAERGRAGRAGTGATARLDTPPDAHGGDSTTAGLGTTPDPDRDVTAAAGLDAPANGDRDRTAATRIDATADADRDRTATAPVDAPADGGRDLDLTTADGDPAATMPGTPLFGDLHDPDPARPAGARNGRRDGPGQDGRPALDPGDPVEAWWLPSSLVDRIEEPEPIAGRRSSRNGRAATRDPVVAGLATGLDRVGRPFRAAARRLAPLVTAMAAPPNRRRRGWLAFARPVVVALALTLLIATATAVPAGMLVADSVKGAGAGLPELEELRQLRQPERTQVYDRQGRVIEVLKDEQDRIVVPLSKISPTLQQAVIAAEDARFYEHKGVDDRGIVRAAVTNLLSGEVSQGGSTITQQLVRNSYPDLKDISIVRKIKEAALAAQLEGKLSKDEILHRYLNRVYFGAGYYGVEAASRGYFRKRASEVSLSQAAMLAGVIREPVSSDPRQHPERAKGLRDSVLERMTQLGMISAADAAKARKEPLKTQKPRSVGGRYPWFIDGLKRQLQEDERLGRTREGRTRRLFEGGLRIHTTLDKDMQLAAERAVARSLPPTGPDIALVAIDPRDGGVRAVVGGRNFKTGAYNAALQGVGRQPGSSFKTFVLAAALNAGISPDSVWESSGFRDQLVCGSPWSVDNYEGGGSGLISVRDATRRSVNGVYARLMEKLCPNKVAEMAERLGVSSIPPEKRVPSMALGSAEVRPIDMASAYATLANLGEYHKPTFFEKVDHRSGRPVIEKASKPERRISAALAWQVNDILKGVITGGTGTAANIGRPAAGKTGTNQAYRDAWFVGYTPQLAVAVWMGHPRSQQSMYNVQGQRVSGGSFPARVWHDFMAAAMANQEVLDWPRPAEQLSYTVLPPAPKEDKKDEGNGDRQPGRGGGNGGGNGGGGNGGGNGRGNGGGNG
jgi:penicillin-binding protein 1A